MRCEKGVLGFDGIKACPIRACPADGVGSLCGGPLSLGNSRFSQLTRWGVSCQSLGQSEACLPYKDTQAGVQSTTICVLSADSRAGPTANRSFCPCAVSRLMFPPGMVSNTILSPPLLVRVPHWVFRGQRCCRSAANPVTRNMLGTRAGVGRNDNTLRSMVSDEGGGGDSTQPQDKPQIQPVPAL